MPTTQRTNTYTTYDHTDDSTFGELFGIADLTGPRRTNTYTTYDHTDDSTLGELFGIADLTGPRLPKCNNHLVSFMKVDGLFISYIVNIFNTIKSRTMVYRSMDC